MGGRVRLWCTDWLVYTMLTPAPHGIRGLASLGQGLVFRARGGGGTRLSHNAPDKNRAVSPGLRASRIHPKPQACGGRVENKKAKNFFGKSRPPVSLSGFFRCTEGASSAFPRPRLGARCGWLCMAGCRAPRVCFAF